MKVTLNYPVKFLGVQFSKPRTIGFEFTNLALFNFRESAGLTDSKSLNEWVKEHGQAAFISEMIHGAAVAYCMIHKVKENFTKPGLTMALALTDEETRKKLFDEWMKSNDTGSLAPKEGDKKKVRKT